MATVSNVYVLYGTEDQLNKFHAPVTAATTYAPGDLVMFSSTVLAIMAAESDFATFTGVSLDLSRAGDDADLNVLRRGIVNLKAGVSSATYTPGLAIKYVSGANGTDWVLAAATGGRSGIMWSNEYAATVTSLDAVFDAYVAGGVAAGEGLWDRLASS
jgi:hypothetical protein